MENSSHSFSGSKTYRLKMLVNVCRKIWSSVIDTYESEKLKEIIKSLESKSTMLVESTERLRTSTEKTRDILRASINHKQASNKIERLTKGPAGKNKEVELIATADWCSMYLNNWLQQYRWN